MNRLKKKIIISLMGVDGAGKTTLAKKLNKVFKNSKYLHLKPYIFFLDRRTVIKNPHNQKKSSFILSLLRIFSWLISYKIFFYQNRISRIYFFDRYAHDVLIDPLRYRHNLTESLSKLILNFFPKTFLWIFLKPSLKTIISRKNELQVNEIRRQIVSYTKFFKNKKNVLNFGNNISQKKLINQIKKKLKI